MAQVLSRRVTALAEVARDRLHALSTRGELVRERGTAGRRSASDLADRVRSGLWAAVIGTAFFALADYFLDVDSIVPLYCLKLALLLAVALSFAALRLRRDDTWVIGTALFVVGVSFLVSSVSAIINQDALTPPLLCSAVAIATATMLPWPVWAQCVLVGLGLVAVSVNAASVYGRVDAILSYASVVVASSFGLSIYLVQVLSRYRAAAARAHTALREEAQVSTGLARISHALIASLDEGELLQRLAQLTIELFDCDVSHTWLPAEEGQWLMAAGFGDSVDEHQALKALRFPRHMVEPILRRLPRDGAVQVRADEPSDLPTLAVARRYGIALVVYMPLRKGQEIVGIHTAAFRGRHTPLPAHLLRLAAGVAQVASLALETARLVEATEEADRFKTDFLAGLSHELRTPLNVIIGYNDMLLDDACGPLGGEQRGVVERAQRNARELLSLMTAALELSRHEARGVPLELAEVRLREVVDEIGREVAALPTTPEVVFLSSVDDGAGAVLTDRLKLRMVLKNLIDNARKFTPRGSVRVSATRSATAIEISVADTGIGIPPAALEHIFEPFRQAPHDGERSGVGLGLYLVRRLLDALGGRVRVESTVGVGSTFRVWIPLAPPTRRGAVP